MLNGTNPPEIASESVYVVYETKTGRIVNVHTVTNFKGGRGQNSKEEQSRILAAAKGFGLRTEGLKVLAVTGRVDLTVPTRVDLKTGKLTGTEAAKKSASSKRGKRKPKAKTSR
jgi:hypothetical protein